MRTVPPWIVVSIGIVQTGQSAFAASTQVWLEKGQIVLLLENGEEVPLEAGNYLSCDEDAEGAESDKGCNALPLALAPAAPAGLIAGLASAPLAASSATVLGAIAVPAVGVAAVAAGVAMGLSSSSQTNSTPSTNN